MNYDRSCNLACPSCRTDAIVLKGEARDTARRVQDWATADHLKDVRRLHVTGSGDAFGSALFHGFLRDFDPSAMPELRMSIGTNGLLFDQDTWDQVRTTAIDTAVVSVDGASQQTYALNRGGDFEVLLHNLHFIGKLRLSGELEAFTLSFVVQENNYAEMPAFVSLGQAVHADTVCFQQLTNWGTFSLNEFRKRAVHRKSHPQHHQFREVLRHPMLGLPIVDLYNLAALRDDTGNV